MSARTTDLILPSGNLVDRPVEGSVPAGSLFPALDEQIIYRLSDDGTAWEEWLTVADFNPGTNAEEVRDIIAAFLTAGAGVTLTHDDVANTLTITLSADIDAEVVRDLVGSTLVAGTGITITVDDAANTVTINASGGTTDPEVVRDVVAATLVAGANVTITPNDAGDTITIDAVGGSGGGGGSGLFRGAWSTLAEVAAYDFVTEIPAAFTTSGRVVRIANPGGTGAPPQAQVVQIGYFNGTYTPYDGSLSITVPAGVTQVRFAWRWPASDSAGRARFLKNGVVVKESPNSTAMPWTVEEYVVAAGDVLTWDNTIMFSSSNPPYLGYVTFLAAADPYMTGQVVTHLGKLWRSTVNNNGSVPGAGGIWVNALSDAITGEASVDEFDGASLDVAWTRVDASSGAAARVTWTQRRGVLSAVHTADADAGSEVHALMRPVGTAMAVGDAFITAFTIMAQPQINYMMGGLILADGIAAGSGVAVHTLTYTSSGTTGMASEVYAKNGYNTTDTAGAGIAVPLMRVYSRLVKTGANTWRHDTSPDGVSWLASGTVTKTLVPTHVGLLISNWGNARPGIVTYETLRRVSGVS